MKVQRSDSLLIPKCFQKKQGYFNQNLSKLLLNMFFIDIFDEESKYLGLFLPSKVDQNLSILWSPCMTLGQI